APARRLADPRGWDGRRADWLRRIPEGDPHAAARARGQDLYRPPPLERDAQGRALRRAGAARAARARGQGVLRRAEVMFYEELRGFDLTREQTPQELKRFRDAMDRCAVGVIRNDRPLTDAQHVAFSKQLGPLLPMKMLLKVGKSKSRFAFAEIIDIGN